MDAIYQDSEYLLELGNQSESSNNGSDITPSLRGGNGEVSYSHESDPDFWLIIGAFLAVWFFAALAMRTLVQIICSRCNKQVKPSSNEKNFDHTVSEARKSMNTPHSSESSEDSSSQTVVFQSYDGDFYIKYEDCGKIRSGFVKIKLKNNGANGYGIKGMCADADGCATITDGHVSYNGDAWWVQEILAEDEERVGLRVISQGKFDFSSDVFAGSWASNAGCIGSYLKFEGKEINTSILDVNRTAAVPEQLTLIPESV